MRSQISCRLLASGIRILGATAKPNDAEARCGRLRTPGGRELENGK